MTTYLIRRSIEGFVVLVAASFLIYSILVLSPGGPLAQVNFECASSGRQCPSPSDICRLQRAYKLDKPWPLNYLTWMFDPNDISKLDGNNNLVPKGVDITLPEVSLGPLHLGGPTKSEPLTKCDALIGVQKPSDPNPGPGWHIRGSGVLTGDLGNSTLVQKGVPVTKAISERLGNTLLLMVSALLISLLIALPIGIISAVKQYSRLDYAATAFSFVGLSMPSFWLGLMLIIFFAVLPRGWHDQGLSWMPYLPTGNITDVGKEDDVLNRIYHLVLPVSVLAFINIANWSRFIRASMLEVLRQDYVRTAWAKGLSMRKVVLKHAMRNSLIPLITVLTLALPGLVQGAIITEAVFAYAGLGRLYISAVTALDFPLTMGFLMIITVLVVLANMLADVLYAVADPRIRYS